MVIKTIIILSSKSAVDERPASHDAARMKN
jgi:hypothetical protein